MKTKGLVAGENGSLSHQEFSIPKLNPSEILIKAAFAGINRADLEQAQGEYPPPPGVTEILGLECSGEIIEIGNAVQGFKVGDQVMSLVSGGAFASVVVADSATTLKVPSYLSLQEAAAVPESLFTFWENAYIAGGLRSGMTFLVHGGASGLGSFSIVMAKALGCRVVTTARGAERVAFARNLGADIIIDTEGLTNEGVAQQLLAKVGGDQVEVIMDHLGGDLFGTHCMLLKKKGRMVLINSALGDNASIDLGALIGKRLQVIGSVLRSRPLAEKQVIATSIRETALPLMLRAKLQVPIGEIFSIDNAQLAFDRIASRKNKGKVLLKI